MNSSELQLKGSTGAWNQWEANHRMFGVVSTYNIEDYTTKLDESKAEYAERLLQAYGIRSRGGNKKQTDGVPSAVLAPAKAASEGGKQRKVKCSVCVCVCVCVSVWYRDGACVLVGRDSFMYQQKQKQPTTVQDKTPPAASGAPSAYAVDLKAALDAFDEDD